MSGVVRAFLVVSAAVCCAGSSQATPPDVSILKLRVLCEAPRTVLWSVFSWTNEGSHDVRDHTWAVALHDLDKDSWIVSVIARGAPEDVRQWVFDAPPGVPTDLAAMIKKLRPTRCNGFDGLDNADADDQARFTYSWRGPEGGKGRLHVYLGRHSVRVDRLLAVRMPVLSSRRVRSGTKLARTPASIKVANAAWPDCSSDDRPSPCRLSPVQRVEDPDTRLAVLVFAGRERGDDASRIDRYFILPRRELDAGRSRVLNLRGAELLKRKKLDAAFKDFVRARELDKDNQAAIYNQARAAARLNDRANLLDALGALKKEPGLRRRIDEEPAFSSFRQDEEFKKRVRGVE